MNGLSRPRDGRTDPFAHDDAAYVLGALGPHDRAAFEDHLRDCPACARSVRDLAGLPTLLAAAEPPPTGADTGVRGEAGAHRPPSTLLPDLLRRLRARRRRRAAIVAALATTVAALTAGVIALIPLGSLGGEPDPGVPMIPLGPYPVSAEVRLTDAEWGTRVDMSCDYDGDTGGDYVLVAVRPDGSVRRITSWYAAPRDTAELSIGTPLRRGEIESLEIRVRDGPVLLRLPVSR